MHRTSSKNPRVFVSHASEDKGRFVMDFATRLRKNGIDAWLDFWEMLPGASLVDKIFEEGLREAQAVIVVLSSHSVTKPWVREELNAAVVKRINDNSLLIPVVLDGVDVPEALRSTVWQTISDPSSYETEFDRIVSAIFRRSVRPELGSAPRYTLVNLPSIDGLDATDVVVLREFGEEAIATDDTIVIETEAVWARVESHSVNRQDFLDALEVLEHHRYLERGREVSIVPSYCKLRHFGFEEFLTRFYPRYSEVASNVVLAIVNDGITESEDFVAALKQPRVVINHVLELLSRRDLIRTQSALGGHTWVASVHARLRRQAERL